MDDDVRDTKMQMMLFYVFFELSKLTNFWNCTAILHEYLESTVLFCFLGIALDSSGWEVFASSFFLLYPIPSKCVFLTQTPSLQ